MRSYWSAESLRNEDLHGVVDGCSFGFVAGNRGIAIEYYGQLVLKNENHVSHVCACLTSHLGDLGTLLSLSFGFLKTRLIHERSHYIPDL